jgi:hypothetical protein
LSKHDEKILVCLSLYVSTNHRLPLPHSSNSI